jgi:hypothetical protein
LVISSVFSIETGNGSSARDFRDDSHFAIRAMTSAAAFCCVGLSDSRNLFTIGISRFEYRGASFGKLSCETTESARLPKWFFDSAARKKYWYSSSSEQYGDTFATISKHYWRIVPRLQAAISIAGSWCSWPTMTGRSLLDSKVISFMSPLTRDDLQFHCHAISRRQL